MQRCAGAATVLMDEETGKRQARNEARDANRHTSVESRFSRKLVDQHRRDSRLYEWCKVLPRKESPPVMA